MHTTPSESPRHHISCLGLLVALKKTSVRCALEAVDWFASSAATVDSSLLELVRFRTWACLGEGPTVNAIRQNCLLQKNAYHEVR
jgi:hypothetical protein